MRLEKLLVRAQSRVCPTQQMHHQPRCPATHAATPFFHYALRSRGLADPDARALGEAFAHIDRLPVWLRASGYHRRHAYSSSRCGACALHTDRRCAIQLRPGHFIVGAEVLTLSHSDFRGYFMPASTREDASARIFFPSVPTQVPTRGCLRVANGEDCHRALLPQESAKDWGCVSSRLRCAKF